MGIGRTGFRRSAWYRGARVRGLGVGLLCLGAGAIAGPTHSTAAKTALPTAHVSGRHAAKVAKIEVHPPKSQLECEEDYGLGTSWHRCFNEPPGSSCKHPLEVQKASATTRGDAKDFTTTYHAEEVGGINVATEQYYSWAPKKGIAMCPYPNGAVYKVSLLGKEYCERVNGKEYCSSESDTKNIPMHTSPTGGSFEYYLTIEPVKSAYLAIRGYYIHPSRMARRR